MNVPMSNALKMAQCEHCRVPFYQGRRDQRFCSGACKTAAWKRRTGGSVSAPAAVRAVVRELDKQIKALERQQETLYSRIERTWGEWEQLLKLREAVMPESEQDDPEVPIQ